MKKFIVTLILIFTLFLTTSCTENNNKYKLTVIDEWGLLIEPLNNEYEAGEIVEVKLGFRSGPSVGIDINGKYIGANAETKYENGHPVISFIMPEKDSILYTTLNGLFTDPCEDSHDFNEGEIVNVPGSDKEIIVYRCIKCGHTISENINDEKYYNLSFTGKTDYLINDISGKYLAESTINIATKITPNAHLELYANGVKLNEVVKPTDGKAIYYHFTMPNEDCVIEVKVVKELVLIVDKPEYLHTPWIENSNGTYLFINNRNELVDYIDEIYKGMMFLPGYSPYEKTSGYNEEFFENNFLIVFQTEEESGGNKNKIASYFIENRVITISLETVTKGESCDMAGFIYFLPLDKDLLDNIDEVKILKDGEDITNREYQYLSLNNIYSELKEINKEEVLEIQYVKYRGSVNPGVLQDVLYTTDKEIIKEMLLYLNNLTLKETNSSVYYDSMIVGKANPYLNIVTNDNTYRISLSDYFRYNSRFYKTDFSNMMNVEEWSKANNILEHSSELSVIFNNNEISKFYNLDTILIKEYNSETYYLCDYHYIQGSNGKIRIIDSKHFEYNYKYYEIVSFNDFEKLMTIQNGPMINIYEISIYEDDKLLGIIKCNNQLVTTKEIFKILSIESFYWNKKELFYDKELTRQLPNDGIKITENLNIYLGAIKNNEEDIQ